MLFRSYWTAIVEPLKDEHEREPALQDAYDEVAALYTRAIELTSQIKEAAAPQKDLPDSAVALSYMVAYVLDIPPSRKQELLEMTSTVLRLNSLAVDLGKVIAQLETKLAHKDLAQKAKRNGDFGKPH